MAENKITFVTRVVQKGTTTKKPKAFIGKQIQFEIGPTQKNQQKRLQKTLHGGLVNFNITEKGQWLLEKKKPEICMICKLPIKEHHKVLKCPMCQAIFHDVHIFEWLKVKGKCPVCMQSLHAWQLEEVEKE
ncbi:MAG: hypothetical protein ACTSYG_13255 [Candidatus Heimdallarchaeota archaeon]|nr:MAG: hypothetical protein DRP02_12770 [Candidatus Gerdarchaeota archaeon]RLI69316.1 MAG: hypothetical protein DRO63_01050 [Candidatus Gerdarchaeota archaeon]